MYTSHTFQPGFFLHTDVSKIIGLHQSPCRNSQHLPSYRANERSDAGTITFVHQQLLKDDLTLYGYQAITLVVASSRLKSNQRYSSRLIQHG